MSDARPTPSALVGVLRPADVRGVRFHATKFRAGYDEETVDEFLDRVERDLAARWAVVDAGYAAARSSAFPQLYLDQAKVSAEHFPATKFRQGYRVEDVEELRQRVADSLSRLDAYLRAFHPAVET